MSTAAERAAARDAEHEAAYEAYLQAVVDSIPPLSDAQRARIADLLAPVPVAVDSSAQHDELRTAS